MVYSPIEDVVIKLGRAPFADGPTISAAVGYLTPEGRFLEWVFDTGSSHTILSTQFLQLRGLDFAVGANPRKGSGLVGNAAWIKATVKVGDAVWRDHEFLTMDVLPDISNAVGQKIDGIMGEDIFTEFAVVEIDFKHQRLILLR